MSTADSLKLSVDIALDGVDLSKLGVAVSGGGDSMALLHMLAERIPKIQCATVDHGLRAESATEADFVSVTCAHIGAQHEVLKWDNWDKKGNLQNAARIARQELLSDWAHRNGLTHIALGHTMDDQAETVLLRLARGSGVDGLSGMSSVRQQNGITWIRPVINVRRAELRSYLTNKNQTWIDDPSNDDTKYDRVKARKALAELEPLGVNTEGLVRTAERMNSAREALEHASYQLAAACADVSAAGELRFSRKLFDDAPEELRYRLIAGGLRWMSGAIYRPRFDSLRNVLANIDECDGQTLHGAILRSDNSHIIMRREPARVSDKVSTQMEEWDHRWQIVRGENAADGEYISALGVKGLESCPDWRATGRPREVLLSTPSIWKKDELIAAPLAGIDNGWQIHLKNRIKGFHNTLMTH